MSSVIATYAKYHAIFYSGAKVTLVISLVSILFGLILGTLLALMKLSKISPFRWLANVYVEIIRGTPVLVQISLVFFGLPQIGIHLPSFQIMGVDFERMSCGIIALVINSAAYICEIVRAGIQSIDNGQMEAARSLGFSKTRSMQLIVLPQAFKNLLPAVGNEFVTLIKTSSQVSVIGMADLMYSATTVQGISFQPFPALVIVAVIYFIVTFFFSSLLKMMEHHMGRSAR